jgi:uncharacterized RDD family membrane protein YckC
MKQVVHPATGHQLAGFGDRLLALLVDSLVQLVVLLPLYVVGFAVVFLGLGLADPDDPSGGAVAGVGMILLFALAMLVLAAGMIAYAVWSVGGPAGQTLGKHLMRVRVVDEHSSASIGYGRAALREILGKWLSGALLSLGYLWMLWDPKMKTWHDMIATSQVVKLPATEEVSIGRWWALVRGRAA